MMNKRGRKVWAFAGGHIPLHSNGEEPQLTSHDKVAILNATDHEAMIGIEVFYDGDDPIGNYEIKVQARRVRKIRFNDLINPLPVPLDTPFGFVLTSDTDVIVQFSRAMTSDRNLAGFCTTPYSIKT